MRVRKILLNSTEILRFFNLQLSSRNFVPACAILFGCNGLKAGELWRRRNGAPELGALYELTAKRISEMMGQGPDSAAAAAAGQAGGGGTALTSPGGRERGQAKPWQLA